MRTVLELSIPAALICMMVLFVSCSTHSQRFPKDSFIKEISSSDFEDYLKDYFSNLPESDRWHNCFELSDQEFIDTIIPIYRECSERGIEKNADNLPEFITAEEAESLADGVDNCAKVRFIVRYKDKFTLEKTPESFDRCFLTYEKFIKIFE